MKITEISKEYLEKGGLIRRKGWDLDISIGLSTSKIDFIYYENSKPKKPTTFFRSLVQDIMADDWELNEKPTQVWKPNVGDKYYYISNTGSILYYMYDEDVTNKAIISIGNCFETKEEAQHMLQKIRIINQLQELSNIKFNENQKSKWCIFYDFDKNELTCIYNRYCKHSPFEVYFESKEDCQKAIETIGEENLKKYYFDVEEEE